MTPPKYPEISCIWINWTSFCLTCVSKYWGSTGAVNTSSPYGAWRELTHMVAGAEPGLGMLFSPRHLASALVMYQRAVSLLQAFLTLFFEGSADLHIASKPKLCRLGLGMRSSSSSSSSEALPLDCQTSGSIMVSATLSGSSNIGAPKFWQMACWAALPLGMSGITVARWWLILGSYQLYFLSYCR